MTIVKKIPGRLKLIIGLSYVYHSWIDKKLWNSYVNIKFHNSIILLSYAKMSTTLFESLNQEGREGVPFVSIVFDYPIPHFHISFVGTVVTKNALKLKNVSYFCVIAKSDRSIGK